MKRMVAAVSMVVAVMSARGAYATSNWGPLDEAMKCEKEVEASTPGFDTDKYDNKWFANALKAGKGISPECKAVIDKRVEPCLKDPKMQYFFDAKKGKAEPKDICLYEHVPGNIWEQVINDHKDKQREAELAREKEAAKAKEAADIAARELPTDPTIKDAKLEKMVADAFNRSWGGDGVKVLKVLVYGWADDLEKDSVGRVTGRDLSAIVVNKDANGKCWMHKELYLQQGNGRSFSGALKARGSGSAEDTEILCSKAEGAAAGGGRAKKGKK